MALFNEPHHVADHVDAVVVLRAQYTLLDDPRHLLEPCRLLARATLEGKLGLGVCNDRRDGLTIRDQHART